MPAKNQNYLPAPGRTFGNISYRKKYLETDEDGFVQDNVRGFMLTDVEPQVAIRMKNLFAQLAKYSMNEFFFPDRGEIAHDLLWFCDRYPMRGDHATMTRLKNSSKSYVRSMREMTEMLSTGYVPRETAIKFPFLSRQYQIAAAEIFMRSRGAMILADVMGLGKSLTAVLPCLMFPKKTLPVLIVCQTHLPRQWRDDVIGKFTDFSTHIIRVGGGHYKLPDVDVLICPYSRLAKWAPLLHKKVKYVIFDECQELRTGASDKYFAARNLCEAVPYKQGLSGSPIMNYAIEMFNILNCLQKNCVGTWGDWIREWGEKTVKDPAALGAYLREQFLVLRRTDTEVGRQLPPLNTIITTVEYDDDAVDAAGRITAQLALSYMTSSNFMEKGQLGREFDSRSRQETGIGKAAGVAGLVRILLESGKPVVLAGWHRKVYEIWNELLSEFKPVMFTGSETPAQKEKARVDFISGKTNLMIISLRSGAGIDGLQHRCKDVVIGELDWSPKFHEQLFGRCRRDGMDDEHVNGYFPLVDEGSDPVIVDVLGLKSEQTHGIMDPGLAPVAQTTDESRIKKLAEAYLKKYKLSVDEKGSLNTGSNSSGESGTGNNSNDASNNDASTDEEPGKAA